MKIVHWRITNPGSGKPKFNENVGTIIADTNHLELKNYEEYLKMALKKGQRKDKVMADEATVGFMIWDGKSIGTLTNVFRLISQNKKVIILYSADKAVLRVEKQSGLGRIYFLVRKRFWVSMSKAIHLLRPGNAGLRYTIHPFYPGSDFFSPVTTHQKIETDFNSPRIAWRISRAIEYPVGNNSI
ncbi:MAG TPA: hypothetical protein VK469_18565 [Candidatus Kapabacteria bacterium]|nr:hypothetical protein [Candidatus Kapabacteria bacterium]